MWCQCHRNRPRNPAPMNSLTDMGLDYTYRNPAPMNSLTDMGLDYSYNPNRWLQVGDVLIEATETPHIVTMGYGAPYRGRSKRFNIIATFPDGAQKVLIRGAKTISGGLQRAANMLEKI